MAGLTRAQELLLQKPSKTKKEALQRKWWRLSLVFVDEISLTAPNLLAVLHGSACYGRLDLSPEDFLSNIFGNVLCQILAGDFLQLNPVRARSLMEAFGIEVPGCRDTRRWTTNSAGRKSTSMNMDLQSFAPF